MRKGLLFISFFASIALIACSNSEATKPANALANSQADENIAAIEEVTEKTATLEEAAEITKAEVLKKEATIKAKKELATIISSTSKSVESSNAAPKPAALPVHNPRLYEEQMVVLPNGISITTTVSNREGREYLWVSDIAPIAIFNKTFLYDHADTDNYIVDDKDYEFEYYYLTVKPDFYQNHITAVQIDAQTYFQIYDAYAAQAK